MGSVIFENVYKAYGQVKIIKGVSLTIEDGEFVTLVGPSGCGKSTLLRMVAGLEDISYGAIRINDRVVNDIPPKDRDIAMVFQNYALYPHMTVADNMGFAMRLRKDNPDVMEKAVREAADILDLSHLLDRYPKQLSGGQRQRVAMGRAIVRKPQVFLFDEPLSNLDAKLRVQMRAEIKQLHQRLRTTTIYVTHDQIEAMTLADRIVVLNRGVVEQAGKPRELFDTPANQFVANFIGSPSMNFLEGRLERTGAVATLVTASGLRLPLPDDPGVQDGAAIVYGVRPEHLRIDPASAIKARVMVVEDTGSETIVLAAIGKDSVTILLREHTAIASGDEIGLSPVPGSSHYFQGKTGLRIATTG
ncbi:MAG: sn-glycerol-3-phosphate ABC transporter ATP-binding protein UgpC [Planctomycetaceae bacterium]|nr:sn-glycerol-3-phosphate ABC transporter ATP-binding protein UgpC [Planctomycetaceae bacterium]